MGRSRWAPWTILGLLGPLAFAALATACESDGGGADAPDVGGGPDAWEGPEAWEGPTGAAVRWEPDTAPWPTMPWPNDAATVADATSPTGRRLAMPETDAATALEAELWAQARTLDGFGVFQPITVPLDGPPDLAAIRARHAGDWDPSDDVLLVVDVDPDSPGFGELMPVSLGDGLFPATLRRKTAYFLNDPREASPALEWETAQEDRNCNGVLDPGEDTDRDGVLDRPNVDGLEAHEDRNCNGTLDPGEDWDCDGALDLNPAVVDGAHEDLNCNGQLDPGEDVDCDGQLDLAPWHVAGQHEDVDCDGELDPGEDLDCDGELDRLGWMVPSAPDDTDGDKIVDPGERWTCRDVFPGRMDPREPLWDRAVADHVTSFWEHETGTLIARPVRPLRERTTYAVVLTRALVDAEGLPVGSPFDTRYPPEQEAALAPLDGALSAAGLDRGADVAFAWTFTTGSARADLDALRAGLYGAGPFAWLAEAFDPVASLELAQVKDSDPDTGDTPPYAHVVLGDDLTTVLSLIQTAGLSQDLPGAEHLSHLIAGTFRSPDFLVDDDGLADLGADAPANDDEHFRLDPVTGEAVHGSADVTFFCAIPKEIPGVSEAPFPVQIYGHGYTFHRLEALPYMGFFAAYGIATCALDAFGHGVSLGPGDVLDLGDGPQPIDEVAVELASDLAGFGGLVATILSNRSRDLNGDGFQDSGGDFWTADAFHTRDLVRQSVVDHLQFVRILRAMDGERVGPLDGDGDGEADLFGDFDGDGVPDLGGPAGDIHAWGISLGGILTAILAGVEPALTTAAPTSGGGGLVDVGLRSEQPGVPEAVFLPVFGPLVATRPLAEIEPDGGHGPDDVELTFLVNDINRERWVPFGRVAVASGDTLVVANLTTGEEAAGRVPDSRRMRLAVAADALRPTERGPFVGEEVAPLVPDSPGQAPKAWPRLVDQPAQVGDRLEVRVVDGVTGELRETVDTFVQDVDVQGARFAAGAPLVALQEGFGFDRHTPELRRFLDLASALLQPADPIAYAAGWGLEPPDVSAYDPDVPAGEGVNVMVVPTAGDLLVPVDTGYRMAAAGGIVGVGAAEADARYGVSGMRHLADSRALESVDRTAWHVYDRVGDPDGDCIWDTPEAPVAGIVDVDDLDHGRSYADAPTPGGPLRATVAAATGAAVAAEAFCLADVCGERRADPGGLLAMRVPFLDHEGQHGFASTPKSCRAYDMDGAMLHTVARWFASRGTELVDHPCVETGECDAP